MILKQYLIFKCICLTILLLWLHYFLALGETELSSTTTDGNEDEDSSANEKDDDDVEEENEGKEDADNAVGADKEDPGKVHKDNDDQTVEKVGEAMEKILTVSNESKELSREEICHGIVDGIRREEFGVGIELGETEQKLMKVSPIHLCFL